MSKLFFTGHDLPSSHPALLEQSAGGDKFNTKQSFVDALTWHRHEQTSWKSPLQTESSKKQVATRKLPGLLFLI